MYTQYRQCRRSTTVVNAVDRGDHLTVDALMHKTDVLFLEAKQHQTASRVGFRKGYYTINMPLCKFDDAKELILSNRSQLVEAGYAPDLVSSKLLETFT